jgi:pectate lyase
VQTGGVSATGGAVGSGGATSSGGASSGGNVTSGGTSSGGSVGSGGTTSGGTASGGTNTSGGTGTGGATSGGAGTGGMKASGGASSGGTSSGGTGGGGMGGTKATGGTSTGGAGTGGGGMTGGDLCKALGYATRTGRSGSAFNVTGGGNATPNVAKSFADLKTWAADGQARVIHVDGNLGAGWSGTSGDRLEVKSNKTIIGMRPGTQLKAPIHISGGSNVIIRNLVIVGPGSNDDQAWDNLNIEGTSKNVWIDHCEFWDGQDGNADVVKGADTVTFTWNIFGYKKAGAHNFSNLVASSDDEPVSEGKLNITLMFNHFTGVAQRQPRCRYGYIHLVNNYFSKDGLQSDYAASAGKDCKILAENNHFYQINNPLTNQHASGSAGLVSRGNQFESTSGTTAGFGTAFTPPYDYADVLVPAAQVKALVLAKAGAKLASPTACSP